jgi:glycosyltransferase involved in cell wall biosynthesis
MVVADPGVAVGGRKGASVHLEEMARAFLGQGGEVFLAATRVERPLEGIEAREIALDADADGVLRDLPEGEREGPSRTVGAELAAIYRDRVFEEALLVAHRRASLDLVYERQSLFSLAGLRAARRLGIPFGLEVNSPLPEEQARWRGLALEALACAIERRLLREADGVFCVSSFLRDRAVRLGAAPARVRVVPNGIDPRQFHPGVAGEAARRRLGLDGAFVVGFCGALRPWHGVEFLLEAFGRFVRTEPAARLLVVGDGPTRARLESSARETLPPGSAIFCGWVPREEVPAHLAACDVVASPHPPIEPFYFSPLKIVEAMAVGRVVLAPDLPAIREIARDGETAVLYRAADPEDFLGRLGALRASEAERRRIGERAAREVLAQRTWAQNAAGVLEALGRVREAVR